MISVVRNIEKIKTPDGNRGNINLFLKRVLIEVVTENYKQMLSEALFLNNSFNIKLDSPLRANEDVLAGLFNKALSIVADRYRPEVLVDRSPENFRDESDGETDKDKDKDKDTNSKNTGHVDFLAWFQQRCIAIELKKASIDCTTLAITDTLEKRWEKVIQQTEEVQNWLETRSEEIYPYPISIGLMVVTGRCAASRKEHAKDRKVFEESLMKLSKNPDFIATYDFPEDFKTQRKFNAESDLHNVYIPYISFIAVAKTKQLRG